MFAKDLSNKKFSPPRHQDTKLKYNKQFFFVPLWPFFPVYPGWDSIFTDSLYETTLTANRRISNVEGWNRFRLRLRLRPDRSLSLFNKIDRSTQKLTTGRIHYSMFDVGCSMFDLPAMPWNRCEANLTIWFIYPCLHQPIALCMAGGCSFFFSEPSTVFWRKNKLALMGLGPISDEMQL